MRLLRFITNIFPNIFTLPQHISDGIEYILDWWESIALEIIANLRLRGLRIIIAIEIEYPISIKMRMHRHMQRIRLHPNLILPAFAHLLLVAGIASSPDSDEQPRQ